MAAAPGSICAANAGRERHRGQPSTIPPTDTSATSLQSSPLFPRRPRRNTIDTIGQRRREQLLAAPSDFCPSVLSRLEIDYSASLAAQRAPESPRIARIFFICSVAILTYFWRCAGVRTASICRRDCMAMEIICPLICRCCCGVGRVFMARTAISLLTIWRCVVASRASSFLRCAGVTPKLPLVVQEHFLASRFSHLTHLRLASAHLLHLLRRGAAGASTLRAQRCSAACACYARTAAAVASIHVVRRFFEIMVVSILSLTSSAQLSSLPNGRTAKRFPPRSRAAPQHAARPAALPDPAAFSR